MKFYDTNAILKLEELPKEKFYISSVTLTELESIKTNVRKDDQVKHRARRAIKNLNHSSNYEVVYYNNEIKSILDDLLLEETPDNKICACASFINRKENIVFVTHDLCCRVIGRDIFHLEVEYIESEKERIYKGYKVFRGSSEEINTLMENIDYSEWNVNEYLIIENTDDGSVKEMRFDGTHFVALKLPPSKYIKGKNALQRCALDALNNPSIPIVAILGTYGSGKSFLCMQMALYHVTEKGTQSKILGVREIRGEGLEPGYLPGDLQDKTGFFFAPLAQQLKGGEFELEDLKQRGVLDFQIPYFLKGTTFPSTVMLADEAEDLSEKQIRLIGTRLGENSQIFFSGDYKQSVVDKTSNNALVKMCNEMKGNPMFACVCLDTDVRSTTSKLFADLFEEK